MQANIQTQTNAAKKVLLVDDYEGIRDVCVDILTSAGYEVTTAANGIDAINILSKNTSFDLIISDVHMPGLDGLRLYGFTSKKYPHLKNRFMFITGDVSKGLQSTLRNAKLPCLTKPFGIADFIGNVNNLTTKAPRADHGGSTGLEKH